MAWSIKQAAEQTGLSPDTLRYYDKQGILCPKRSEGGYRQYDDNDITSLKNLVVMKYAQFSLAEVKAIEELFRSDPSENCSRMSKRILKAKSVELKQVIANYQKIVVLIESLLPMIDSTEAYKDNAQRIDSFISQIFDDIRSGSLQLNGSVPTQHTKEGR